MHHTLNVVRVPAASESAALFEWRWLQREWC
jgi:hypothetical protein